MPDLSITAANVVAGAGAVVEDMVASATLTAGRVVFKSDTDGTAGLADNHAGATNARIPYGIALNGASAGQPVRVLRAGQLTIGATMTAGTVYFLSATAGGICPVADLATGQTVSVLGVAISATVLLVNITPSGVQL